MGAAMKTLRALGGAQEPKEGALSMLYAATTAPDAETGSYYGWVLLCVCSLFLNINTHN